MMGWMTLRKSCPCSLAPPPHDDTPGVRRSSFITSSGSAGASSGRICGQRRSDRRDGPGEHLGHGEPVQVSHLPGYPEGPGVHSLRTHLLHGVHQQLLGPSGVGTVQLPPVPGCVQPSAGAAEEHGARRGRRQTQAERDGHGAGALPGGSRGGAVRLLRSGEQAQGGQVVPGLPGVFLRASHPAPPGGRHAAAAQAGGRGGEPGGAAVRPAPLGFGARGERRGGGGRGGVERGLPAVRG